MVSICARCSRADCRGLKTRVVEALLRMHTEGFDTDTRKYMTKRSMAWQSSIANTRVCRTTFAENEVDTEKNDNGAAAKKKLAIRQSFESALKYEPPPY